MRVPNSWTFHDGRWLQGNPLVMGPHHHAVWQGSVIFDGARAFEGFAPDLARHCARAVDSAVRMLMAPTVSAERILELALEGIRKFPAGTALYIRPMFYAESGFVFPDPETTQFLITVYESPMPSNDGLSATLGRFRRPAPEAAPTDAKAACLYPNGGRALHDARQRGFTNAVVCDHRGAIAEFATANLFMAKDGVVHTAAANGSFLNGITRQRVIGLLRGAGVTVLERRIRPDELDGADEIFSSGNYGKVQPYTRYEGRVLPAGPLYAKARELYWQFAADTGRVETL